MYENIFTPCFIIQSTASFPFNFSPIDDRVELVLALVGTLHFKKHVYGIRCEEGAKFIVRKGNRVQ